MIITEAEEVMRLQYRASLDRIMKMSIYDNKSIYDVQFMVNEFMFHSGNPGIGLALEIVCASCDPREFGPVGLYSRPALEVILGGWLPGYIITVSITDCPE